MLSSSLSTRWYLLSSASSTGDSLLHQDPAECGLVLKGKNDGHRSIHALPGAGQQHPRFPVHEGSRVRQGPRPHSLGGRQLSHVPATDRQAERFVRNHGRRRRNGHKKPVSEPPQPDPFKRIGIGISCVLGVLMLLQGIMLFIQYVIS